MVLLYSELVDFLQHTMETLFNDTLSRYLGHLYHCLHLKDPTCCAETSELLAVSLAAVAVRTKKFQACFIVVLLECTAESDLQ